MKSARDVIAETIYADRWGADNHEFAGERMDGAERDADLILAALKEEGYRIWTLMPCGEGDDW